MRGIKNCQHGKAILEERKAETAKTQPSETKAEGNQSELRNKLNEIIAERTNIYSQLQDKEHQLAGEKRAELNARFAELTREMTELNNQLGTNNLTNVKEKPNGEQEADIGTPGNDRQEILAGTDDSEGANLEEEHGTSEDEGRKGTDDGDSSEDGRSAEETPEAGRGEDLTQHTRQAIQGENEIVL